MRKHPISSSALYYCSLHKFTPLIFCFPARRFAFKSLLFMNIPLIKKIMPVHLHISQLLLPEIVPITLKSFSIVLLFTLFFCIAS